MLTKTTITISAFLLIGFASAAFANVVPENKIGDRYPLLELTAQSATSASAFASSAVQPSKKPFTAAERVQFDRASRSQSY